MEQRRDRLVVGYRNANLVVPCGIKDSKSLRHLDEIGGVVEVEEGLAERRSLERAASVEANSAS